MTTKISILAMLVVGAVLAPTAGLADDRPFLRMAAEAIESKSGQAQYTFGADVPWVRLMRQKVEFPGPVRVETSVVKRYQQEGCARVRHRFHLIDAMLVKGKMEPMIFQMDFNVCTNGEPPVESLDIRTVEDAIKARHAAEAQEPPPLRSGQEKKPAAPSGAKTPPQPSR